MALILPLVDLILPLIDVVPDVNNSVCLQDIKASAMRSHAGGNSDVPMGGRKWSIPQHKAPVGGAAQIDKANLYQDLFHDKENVPNLNTQVDTGVGQTWSRARGAEAADMDSIGSQYLQFST